MGDSTCVFQSFEHSSLQQGDTAVRALTESVSFGRFVTETLEWDKWSIFSQNRYLEEAKRFSKPGLVAQKKALLEAHFKKISADKAAAATAAALRELDTSNSSTNFKPCVYMESVTFDQADAADCSLALELSSLSGEVYIDDRIASAAEVSDSVSASNSGDAAKFVEMDEPRSDLAIDKAEDLKVCDKMDAHFDINKFNHTVVEPSSFQKFNHPDGLKTELERCEVVNNSAMLLDDLRNKISVQEPADQFVVASPGRYKPNATCSKTLVSVKKLGVQSNTIPKPPAFPSKENNTTRNTKAFGSAMLNKRKETLKSLHESINLKTTHLDFKRPPTPKKLDSAKSSAISFSLRSSKEHPGPSQVQVSTNIGSQKKQATASGSFSAIMKSSTTLYSRPVPSQLKKDKIVMQMDSASMRNTSDMTKSKPKSLHMSINLDSHIAKKERLVSSPRTGTKIDATSIRMSMTHSTHAPGNQVILDSTMTRKKIIPIPNSSADVRKLITQFHGKPGPPPMYKNKNSSIQSNTALTFSHVDKMKSIPKSLHMSVDLSSTVGVLSKPAPSQKRASYSVNALTARSSAIQGSRMESIQTASGMKDTEKCPPQKVDRPETPRNLIRPPSPTVPTPFRFRSDERAAKRNEILEKKCNFKSENSLEMKGKFPSSRPQSPYARKTTPKTGKAGL